MADSGLTELAALRFAKEYANATGKPGLTIVVMVLDSNHYCESHILAKHDDPTALAFRNAIVEFINELADEFPVQGSGEVH